MICFEAVPDNTDALRYNVELNDAEELISVFGVGLGDAPDVVEIQVEGALNIGEGTGTANILPSGSTLDPNNTYACVEFPIRLTTLDALMSEYLVWQRVSDKNFVFKPSVTPNTFVQDLLLVPSEKADKLAWCLQD